MNAVSAVKIGFSAYSVAKSVVTTRAAIKASRAERKFWEDLSASVKNPVKAEPIRVTCERLA